MFFKHLLYIGRKSLRPNFTKKNVDAPMFNKCLNRTPGGNLADCFALIMQFKRGCAQVPSLGDHTLLELPLWPPNLTLQQIPHPLVPHIVLPENGLFELLPWWGL